jgi:hypothetical protein
MKLVTSEDATSVVLALADGCASTKDVARRLQRAHVKGTTGDAMSCVVAKYITLRLTEMGYEQVQVGVCDDFGVTQGGSTSLVSVELPEIIRLLVGEFDLGEFPELEESIAVVGESPQEAESGPAVTEGS